MTKNEAYSLGLLYVYIYSGMNQTIISEETLNNFYECLKQNLLKDKNNPYDNSNIIYYCTFDETGKKYCVLKNDFDLIQAKADYIGIVPVSYLVAAQMPNALDILGLVKIGDKIKLKSQIDFKQKSKILNKTKNI